MASDYLRNKFADHLHGKSAYTAPANIYIALSTADPGNDGSTIAEPSGGSYARVSTAAADWTAASGGITSNVNAVTFAVPTGNWGTIRYVCRFDALSGGNMLDHAALPEPQLVDVGSDAPEFDPGQLIFTAT